MRPRFRTIKPELWCDERFGQMTLGAQLTFIGLVSAADDRGRLQLTIPGIRGYLFPHAVEVSDRMVAEWVAEIVATGMALRYEAAPPASTDPFASVTDTVADTVADTVSAMTDTPCLPRQTPLLARADTPLGSGAARPYLWLPNFCRHQRIDRPSESLFPAHPADPYGHLSAKEAGARWRGTALDERSTSARRGLDASRAHAGVPALTPCSPGDRQTSRGKSDDARTRPRRVAQDQPPPDLPAELADTVHAVLTTLVRVQAQRGGAVPTVRGVGMALNAFPGHDHLGVVSELEHWALAGNGQAAAIKDWVRQYRAFLARSAPASPIRVAANGGPRSAANRRPNASELLLMLDHTEEAT
ncbi:MAG: hypothetical protein ABSB73_12595 [Solirubrobacteraceae bacterium]|jgi:hypothetical protein